ncbi:hypothetical protein C0J52_18834 [Blattella germanica]|nr:hypothetical protein C0J52_18834 [Blattella germanica]
MMNGDVAYAICCSHGTAYIIIHEQLKFHRVCAWWIPHQLSVYPSSASNDTLRKELHGMNCYRGKVLDSSPLSTRIQTILHGLETYHFPNKIKSTR